MINFLYFLLYAAVIYLVLSGLFCLIFRRMEMNECISVGCYLHRSIAFLFCLLGWTGAHSSLEVYRILGSELRMRNNELKEENALFRQQLIQTDAEQRHFTLQMHNHFVTKSNAEINLVDHLNSANTAKYLKSNPEEFAEPWEDSKSVHG